MNTITSDHLLEQLHWRYAVKKFDPQKKIAPDTWSALEQALTLTPSSYGLQPWKFFVITNSELKKVLRSHSWNQSQVEDCSHYLILSTLKKISEDDIDRHLENMSRVRSVPIESFDGFRKVLVNDAVTGPRSKWVKEWCARQAYIALGNFMTSATLLGVDTCPMEGFDPEKYNEVLNLDNSPFHSTVACAAGYRSADDRYGKLKKVRFPVDTLVVRKN